MFFTEGIMHLSHNMDKTYLLSCEPNEDSNQPVHLHSMINHCCLHEEIASLAILNVLIITKTRLYNFDPFKPHFYIVKLGFTGVYIIFFIFAQKHRLWVLVRSLVEAVLTSTHNLCFEQKHEKYQSFSSENFQVLESEISIYLNRRVFVMLNFLIRLHKSTGWPESSLGANVQRYVIWCCGSFYFIFRHVIQ